MLLVTSLGCSLGRILVGEPTPTPTRVPPTPLPTWTPLLSSQLSPADIATLTVQAALAWPTLTPTSTPTSTETPTPTITPTPSETLPPTLEATLTPTPYVVVAGQQINLRDGPSVAYPVVGVAYAGEQFTVVGRNEPATWWKVCCYDGREVWVSAQVVTPQGSFGEVVVVGGSELAEPPPPTETPPATETPRPYRPFDIGDGPQFFVSNNAWLTVWIKTFAGQPPASWPVPGYRLRVLRNGADVSKQDSTKPVFELSAPLIVDDQKAYGNRREYNLKYEYLPEAGDAQWTIYLIDSNGVQVSPEVTFQTERAGPLREVYVGFFDTR